MTTQLNPIACVRLPCDPATPLASSRLPAAFGETTSRLDAPTLLRLGYRPFYLPSIFDRELYFAGSVERRVDELHEMFARTR